MPHPFPPDAVHRVPVDGGTLHVRVDGALDGPRAPLVMVHGGPGGAHDAFVAALPLRRQRAVVLYDQLDCGLSDRPDDPANWTVERFVSEIDAVRCALGLDRLHLLGASWGGLLAAEYAATRPAGLLSVILQGPLISTPRWLADAARLRATLPRRARETLDQHETAGTTDDPDYRAAEDVFYARYFARRPYPPAQLAYRATISDPFNWALYRHLWGPNEFHCTGALRDHDAAPRLRHIAAPTLLLCGAHDEILPDTARAFAGMIPHGEVAIIPDAAHRIQTDAPEAYRRAVAAWCARFD